MFPLIAHVFSPFCFQDGSGDLLRRGRVGHGGRRRAVAMVSGVSVALAGRLWTNIVSPSFKDESNGSGRVRIQANE